MSDPNHTRHRALQDYADGIPVHTICATHGVTEDDLLTWRSLMPPRTIPPIPAAQPTPPTDTPGEVAARRRDLLADTKPGGNDQ